MQNSRKTHTSDAEPPFELTAMSLVNLGPDYARIISLGKRGASNVIWISPRGHEVLGQRLRARAKGTP